MNAKPSQDTEALGAFLQHLREAAEMEQGDVAESLGVSRVTVSRWENAKRAPSRSVVRELVMLYMARGATPDANAAAAAGVEIPKRSSERAPGEMAYATPDYLHLPVVREGAVAPEYVLKRALEQTEANLVRLSEISGYAKGVLEMMRAVTAAQEKVVSSLAPWVRHEEQIYDTDPQILEDAAEDVIRDAERVARERQQGSPKRRKSSGE